MKKIIWGILFTALGILSYAVFHWKNVVGAIFLACGALAFFLLWFEHARLEFSRGIQIGKLLMAFGLLCLLTAFVLNMSEGGKLPPQTFSPEDAPMGPVTVENARDIYKLHVNQQVEYGHWSAVSGEVLDQDKNLLFGFGDELWAETGYDEGTWYESKTDYEFTFLLEKGTYFIRFECECSAPPCRPFTVTMERRMGSGVPFVVPGTLTLVLGLLIWLFAASKEAESSAIAQARIRREAAAAKKREKKTEKQVPARKSGDSGK